jgi:hypothetical protein
MKAILLVVLISLSAGASATCYTNRYGKVVCENNGSATAVNTNRGTSATATTNSNGVTTTQGSRGGEAKTRNGKGVYQAPGGTTCARTANSRGCTK